MHWQLDDELHIERHVDDRGGSAASVEESALLTQLVPRCRLYWPKFCLRLSHVSHQPGSLT
jgi:hypothetical protein